MKISNPYFELPPNLGELDADFDTDHYTADAQLQNLDSDPGSDSGHTRMHAHMHSYI